MNQAEFFKDFLTFQRISTRGDFPPLSLEEIWPCLNDRTETTAFDAQYIYHTAWAARVLAETRPDVHVDISSFVFFPAMMSAFVPIKFYDFRPSAMKLPGLECGAADILALPFESGSIRSLSCMHVVEHIGLGRYGDPIDPDGDIKAIKELKRVLARNGNLLFAVPMGRPRIQFNAHRIFSYDQIMDGFSGLELRELALVTDTVQLGNKLQYGSLIRPATRELANRQDHGCGCFWLTKT